MVIKDEGEEDEVDNIQDVMDSSSAPVGFSGVSIYVELTPGASIFVCFWYS